MPVLDPHHRNNIYISLKKWQHAKSGQTQNKHFSEITRINTHGKKYLLPSMKTKFNQFGREILNRYLACFQFESGSEA